MMKRIRLIRRSVLPVCMALLLCLTACSLTDLTQTDDLVQQLSAPEQGILNRFSTTDLSGNPVDQSVLEDYSLTMINVWATFCGPCLQEMPDLGQLAREYQSQNVQVIGFVVDVLNSDDTLNTAQVANAKEITLTTQASYTHIVPSQDLMGLLNQINSVPTTFFVDRNGCQVGSAYIGSKTKDEWDAILQQVLREVEP